MKAKAQGLAAPRAMPPAPIQLRARTPSGERLHRLIAGVDVVVGRGEDVDVYIEDGRVSRRHCQLSWQADGLEIVDLGSSNGTWLNAERLTGRRRLRSGDRVEVGDSLILVEQQERRRSSRTSADAKRLRTVTDRVRNAVLSATRGELREMWRLEQETNHLLRLGARQYNFSLTDSAVKGEQDVDLVFYRHGKQWAVAVNADDLPSIASAIVDEMDIRQARENVEYVEAAALLAAVCDRNETLSALALHLLTTHRDWLDFPERQRDLGQLDLTKTAQLLGLDPTVLERVTSRTWVKTPDGTFALRLFFRAVRGWTAPPDEERTMVSPPPRMTRPTPAPTAGPSPPIVESWLTPLSPSMRRVLTHLDTHGVITEHEVAEMLGGPREQRRFALGLDALMVKAPFRVRVEFAGGIKRYVKESIG